MGPYRKIASADYLSLLVDRVYSGAIMEMRPTHDIAAIGAILMMFLGAFSLPKSSLGLIPIIAGGAVMLFLMLNAVRKKP